VEKGDFRALVIGNQAGNFSAGAQLQLVLELSKQKRWKMLEQVIHELQAINLGLHHASFPVVTAPHGMTLGGGLEVTFAGQKRVPYTELYCGLVEVGVGLIPAGGGCLGLLMQFIRTMRPANPGPMPPMMKAFDLIGFGKVSSSANDAIDKGLLAKDNTVIAPNKDRQIADAKKVALSMLKDFKPIPQEELYLPGPGGFNLMAESIEGFRLNGTITDHSAKIARHHVKVLTGGDKASVVNPVSEQYILDLEREAFLALCGEPMSQERMGFMLKKGKPLIN
jgi:3-hydroxyacyl-CoA dehydrogenase